MANSSDSPDRARRRLLLRLGLATTIAYAAPAMLALNGARASDSVSGPTAPSPPSPPSLPSLPSWPAQRAQHAERPELIVSAPARADFAPLEAAGFPLLGAEQVALLGVWIGRFGLPQGLDLDAARQRAREILPTAGVEENALYRTAEMLCGQDGCAAFDMIDWPQHAPCPAAPVIGMIDAGINPEHDAFAGRALEVIPLDLGTRPPAGATHGTAVAALLIGSGDSRTPGLLPGASLIAVEAFHTDAQGEAADAFTLLRGLDELAGRHVDVVNLSLAGPHNALLEQAVAALVALDIAIVAAAGNAGPRADPLYPAAYAGVLAVTAVDANAAAYRQASAGEHIAFAAPGVRIWTAASISGGRLRSGTSYAAPFVTAALAAARYDNPGLSLADAIETLATRALDLGEPGFDPVYGWGLIQAEGICIVPA